MWHQRQFEICSCSNRSPTVLAASIVQITLEIKAAAGADVVVPADFLTGALVPKSGTTAGNPQDQILELLRTRNLINATGGLATAIQGALNSNAGAHTVTGATGGS